MSKLISAIQDIIGIFQNYSQKDCSHNKLNKEELNLLIQNEFSGVIKNPKDPNTISSLIKILDEDNDGEVDFNEFCDLLCKVLKAYYKVVYEKEDTCQQQDQPKKDGETISDTTAKVTDEPPKFYQKPLYPKSEKTPSLYHDQKGVSCGDQNSKIEKTQVSTQTDPKKVDTLEAHDSIKEPTIKIEETSPPSTGNKYDKDQASQEDMTGSKSNDFNQSNDQKSTLVTSETQSQSYDESKDTISKQVTTEVQPTSYNQGKEQAQQDTTETESHNQGKDQTSPKDTNNTQLITHGEDKVQTKPDTAVSQSNEYESGKDQTQGTSSSQSISHEQGKAQTCHAGTTSSNTQLHDQSQQSDTNSSQSISSKDDKDQLDTTGSQSHHNEKSEDTTTTQSQDQGKEPETTSHTTVNQPGQIEELKKFYQKSVYLPPAQGFGLATSQPPPYTETQQDPNPESHEIPQEPQQPQKTMFYQYQQTCSSQKKNP